MALEIKICGISTPETARAAVESGATHLGFVHFAKSPRHLSMDEAAALMADVSARTVMLLVDPDDATLDAAVRARPDMIQLHGREPPERVREVRERTGLPIVKAFAVAQAADLDRARLYEGLVERFLFDSKPPSGADLPGGNGVGFDHDLLAGWDGGPFWLAGGLRPDNVAEAVRRVRPGGIDLSSGVESAPGSKDPALIRALFDALAL